MTALHAPFYPLNKFYSFLETDKRHKDNSLEPEQKRCLNCGTLLKGAFCHNCGQSADTKRLNASTFWSLSVNGIMNIDMNLIRTIRLLLIKPWYIIRNYINGKRVDITPPILLFVIILFFDSIIDTILQTTGLKTPEEPLLNMEDVKIDEFISDRLNQLINWLFDMPAFLLVSLIPPGIFAIQLAYKNSGAKRYNWVEYFFAGAFLLCATLIADILTTILCIPLGINATYMTLPYMGFIFIVTLWQAFPTSIGKSISKILLAFFYCVIFFGLFFGVITLVFIPLVVFLISIGHYAL